MDGKTELDVDDDVATQILGSDWRTPSNDQIKELISNTKMTPDVKDGVSGLKVTSKSNGKSIFFPNGGFCMSGELQQVGEKSIYWSRTVKEDADYSTAYCLYGSKSRFSQTYKGRYTGGNIRPVRMK